MHEGAARRTSQLFYSGMVGSAIASHPPRPLAGEPQLPSPLPLPLPHIPAAAVYPGRKWGGRAMGNERTRRPAAGFAAGATATSKEGHTPQTNTNKSPANKAAVPVPSAP